MSLEDTLAQIQGLMATYRRFARKDGDYTELLDEIEQEVAEVVEDAYWEDTMSRPKATTSGMDFEVPGDTADERDGDDDADDDDPDACFICGETHGHIRAEDDEESREPETDQGEGQASGEDADALTSDPEPTETNGGAVVSTALDFIEDETDDDEKTVETPFEHEPHVGGRMAEILRTLRANGGWMTPGAVAEEVNPDEIDIGGEDTLKDAVSTSLTSAMSSGTGPISRVYVDTSTGVNVLYKWGYADEDEREESIDWSLCYKKARKCSDSDLPEGVNPLYPGSNLAIVALAIDSLTRYGKYVPPELIVSATPLDRGQVLRALYKLHDRGVVEKSQDSQWGHGAYARLTDHGLVLTYARRTAE